jgi:hypothetical protein
VGKDTVFAGLTAKIVQNSAVGQPFSYNPQTTFCYENHTEFIHRHQWLELPLERIILPGRPGKRRLSAFLRAAF